MDTRQPPVFPELDDLTQLLSDQEEVLPEPPTHSHLPSLTGTSAPLLSNPALTDTLSYFPLLDSQVSSFVGAESAVENEPSVETESENQAPPEYSPVIPPTPDRSTRRRGRPRGRPTCRKRSGNTSSSKTTATTRGPITRRKVSVNNVGPGYDPTGKSIAKSAKY